METRAQLYEKTEHRREYRRNWCRESLQKKRLAWLAENGPCKQCGSVERLEVDHVDPTSKVDHKVWSWAPERRAGELAKCQVLCHQCHKIKSADALRRPIQHGTHTGYSHYDCRCQACRTGHAEYARARWRLRTKVDAG